MAVDSPIFPSLHNGSYRVSGAYDSTDISVAGYGGIGCSPSVFNTGKYP